MSSLRSHAGWLVLTVAAAAGAVMLRPLIPAPTAVDFALPWIALACCAAAWMCRDTAWELPALLCPPLLLIACVFASGEKARLLAFGVTYALSVSCAAACRAGHRLRMGDGLALLLIVALPYRLIGTDPRTAMVTLAMVGGCAAVLIVRTGWNSLLVSAAMAMATPADPWRAAVFPWIVTALVAPVPPFARPLLVLSLAIAGGRWSWPFVLIAGAIAFLERRNERSRDLDAAPFYAEPLTILTTLRSAVFFPEALMRRDRMALIATVILAGSMFLRPPVAVLYVLAAIALAALTDARDRLHATPAVLLVAMLCLLSWSGAVVGAFPLPLELWLIAVMAGCALLVMVPLPDLVRTAGALLLVAVAGLATARPGTWRTAVAVIAPGESATFAVADRGAEIELSMSGGNIAGLPRKTPLGTIDLIDRRGNAYRTSIHIGDLSDWSALSPAEYWRNHNGLPRTPRGPIEGIAAGAFVNGSGIVRATIPDDIATVRITAVSELPEPARLHVDAMKVRTP